MRKYIESVKKMLPDLATDPQSFELGMKTLQDLHIMHRAGFTNWLTYTAFKKKVSKLEPIPFPTLENTVCYI